MKNTFNKTKQGFTIIEVMIVLAIAGLILAIVFFAVPQLQRNQRDNQRQSMNTRLKAELDTYSSNNQGTYPFAGVTNTWTDCSTASATAQSCYDWYNRYICTTTPCTTATSKVNTVDPTTGNPVTIRYSNLTANPAAPPALTAGDTYISVGGKCKGDSLSAGTSAGTASSKQYAILTVLDRTGTFYCVDNG